MSDAPRVYDPAIDAWLSWREAIRELRRRGVASGRFAPIDDEERAWLAAAGEGQARP